MRRTPTRCRVTSLCSLAFSCKGRGFCPSSGGRRMADTAVHLVDRVLPEVPVRQWVPWLPVAVRYRLAYDARLVRDVSERPLPPSYLGPEAKGRFVSVCPPCSLSWPFPPGNAAENIGGALQCSVISGSRARVRLLNANTLASELPIVRHCPYLIYSQVGLRCEPSFIICLVVSLTSVELVLPLGRLSVSHFRQFSRPPLYPRGPRHCRWQRQLLKLTQ